ncbi:MAG: GTPase ObgE [Deltaproteobacteria bacterium]|nr:MAG: GTPase ObgE [Deltaproteobacteria bacterium]
MHLIDEVVIQVYAGNGGNGCIAFRREKYRPRGGPSGGDGGRGGDVLLVATNDLSTLLDLRYRRHYKAKSGEHGRGKDQHGRGGQTREIRVPVGTMVYNDETGELLADLVEDGQILVAAKGGRGGLGNINFKTATRQAPEYATPGELGEEFTLRLELKLLADVGIIGFPNVGKSTLISKISKARPKIADYAFTTLSPNLGVAAPPRRDSFVVADVPGLVPGAHQGVGLGIRFLRHIERTRVFLHILELSDEPERDPIQDYEIIMNELALYEESSGSDLLSKPVVVAINKAEDLELAEICEEEYGPYFHEKGIPFFVISAKSGHNLVPLLHTLGDVLEQDKKEELEEEVEDDGTWSPV